MSARDDLAPQRGELQDLVGDAAERDDDDWYLDAANSILVAGYRKRIVLGYVVVSRDGTPIGESFSDRATAQARADEWTNDCKTGGVDWDYRVAEIVEAAA